MKIDPKKNFIKNIMKAFNLKDKTVLEIGCGKGLVTKQLVKYAKEIIAIDPDKKAIQEAKFKLKNYKNTKFLVGSGENLAFKNNSFDLVVYSLSLHHITKSFMEQSLHKSMSLLKPNGKIIILEPSGKGTFIQAEEKYSIGDGDERDIRKYVCKIINSTKFLKVEKEKKFRKEFLLEGVEDFFNNFVPKNYKGDKEKLINFLDNHKKNNKIKLYAEIKLILLNLN